MNVELYVPLDELMTATGLGPIQIRREIRAELLPGRIRGTTVIVLRSEWDAYLAGTWVPRRPASGFVHRLGA